MDPRFEKVSIVGERFIQRAVLRQLFLMEQTGQVNGNGLGNICYNEL